MENGVLILLKNQSIKSKCEAETTTKWISPEFLRSSLCLKSIKLLLPQTTAIERGREELSGILFKH
jgi:hypothetical protein